jgi:high-affinity iron transporter
MFASFLIGLREGLEASLVVSILVAYLVRTSRRNRLPLVWAGVAAALAISIGFGALLQFTSADMSFYAQERFGGIMSIVAVGFVTWMVFWMKRTARGMSQELRGRLDAAVAVGPAAVVLMAFLSVGREGLETSLFFWAAAQQADTASTPVTGFSLGIATAVVLATLLYFSTIHLNIAKFFHWTGFFLIFVAAGVLSYGFHDLQEAGDLPGLNNLAFDISGTIAPDSWYGTILKGVFNFSPATTWLEATVWLVYIVPVLVLYLGVPRRRTPRGAGSPAPAPQHQPVA